jgi:hypothetical protein
MRHLLFGILLLFGATTLSARGPLYVVNGTPVKNIDNIEQANIANIDVLPATEETIEKWGIEASEGVILVTLNYDTAAEFRAEGYDNFTTYLQHHVKWDKSMPAERVSLRIKVDSEGRASIVKVLESTSRQFQKRVERTIASAPCWRAATKDGVSVESIHLVNLLLPEGKTLPVEPGVILM